MLLIKAALQAISIYCIEERSQTLLSLLFLDFSQTFMVSRHPNYSSSYFSYILNLTVRFFRYDIDRDGYVI